MLLLLSCSQALAKYRYVIYTDEPSGQKAQEVAHYFRNTTPFNEFDIEIVVKQMSSEELKCGSYPGIERLVTCDERTIQRKAMSEDFDQAFVVSDRDYYGGSGGQVPVITSSRRTPITMISHEYMHLLGFCDEYEFSEAEADYYCSEESLRNKVNAVEITPKESGYSSDQEARGSHSGQIPWYGEILGTTPISAGTLGSPANHAADIGLFENNSCKKAKRKVHLWRPGGGSNIMHDLTAPVAPYENLLRQALASAGLQRRPSPPPPISLGPCPRIDDQMPLPNKLIMDYNRLLRRVGAQ